MPTLRFIAGCTLLLGLSAAAAPAGRNTFEPAAQPTGQDPRQSVQSPSVIDPLADKLLKQMSTYIAGLPAFTVRATNTLQLILVTGEKLDFEARSDVSVQRPDRLHSHRVGVVADADFFFDGKTITVFDRSTKFYSTVEAPQTLDAMLGGLSELLDVEVPGADLLYTDVYAGLMSDVTHAHYVGLEDAAGARTHHLAFRGRETDWQIWIEDGERPLPRRYVITTKWMTGAPQFGVLLTDWNVSPQIEDTTFIFEPPAGARRSTSLGRSSRVETTPLALIDLFSMPEN